MATILILPSVTFQANKGAFEWKSLLMIFWMEILDRSYQGYNAHQACLYFLVVVPLLLRDKSRVLLQLSNQ